MLALAILQTAGPTPNWHFYGLRRSSSHIYSRSLVPTSSAPLYLMARTHTSRTSLLCSPKSTTCFPLFFLRIQLTDCNRATLPFSLRWPRPTKKSSGKPHIREATLTSVPYPRSMPKLEKRLLSLRLSKWHSESLAYGL